MNSRAFTEPGARRLERALNCMPLRASGGRLNKQDSATGFLPVPTLPSPFRCNPGLTVCLHLVFY